MVIKPKKAPKAKALGAFFMFWALALPAQSHCPPPEGAERETAVVASVIDGDTVRLQDGRRVRFLGVDAPELGRSGEPHEPLALEAHALVLEWTPPGHPLTLVYDAEREDRFGRTLAYLYDAKGRSLEAELLRQGLAFHVAVPPNLALADCLREQQEKARLREVGVWGHRHWQPTPAADVSQGGFQLVSGKVTDVSFTRDTVWLELDGPVVIQVPASDRHYFNFTDDDWERWLGRTILVSGWVIDRSESRAVERGFQPWMMRLRSPHALLSNAQE
ncbi:thermonuclease family protein [Marinimicrobium sp. ABcell2]|uniref:thermonuclease family protein n=1 Tax=Marinimicrobium sp. ABcell2 TaxID=3069751 RepID=UPI0027B62DDD|nr:thermonuclease family protein [Marinimicrobium sp. ABcell2]MDQ2076518.1 thermonuclease family protein [Marinimicrobium sp. ABcell2]